MGALITYINSERHETKTDEVCKWTQKGKLKYKGQSNSACWVLGPGIKSFEFNLEFGMTVFSLKNKRSSFLNLFVVRINDVKKVYMWKVCEFWYLVLKLYALNYPWNRW